MNITSNTNRDIEQNKLIYNNVEILIIIDKYNNIWIEAIPIAKLLSFNKPKNAIKMYIIDKNKKFFINFKQKSIFSINDNTNFINEIGLYCLIMASKKGKAIYFKEWIINSIINYKKMK